jgi:hypothetical protein
VKFLLAMWVFWGATVSNFRYFRMSAASDLYCMLIAEFLVAAKGNPARSTWQLAARLDLSRWLKRRSNRGKGEVA